jgi:fimbrial chaperone protein
MRSVLAAGAFALAFAGSLPDGLAATLQVSPVNVEVKAPALATVLTLRNLDEAPVNAQIRVFRWSQKDGKDVLLPTDDVVASPPAAQLLPGTEYTVRVVRVGAAPLDHEEAYRLLVDQVPDPAAVRGDAVNFAIRYSIPVFFSKPAAAPDIAWRASVSGGHLVLTGLNGGKKRLRVASLKATDASGKVVNYGDGLVGYVLSQSAMRWTSKAVPKGFAAKDPITITLKGDNGPVKANAVLEGLD